MTNPIGSTALVDLQRNAQDMDRFINQETGTVTTRLGEVLTPIPVRDAQFAAAMANSGLFPAAGSFEAGGTITQRNQYLQLITTVGGNVAGGYTWGGALPKVVPSGSSPSTTGGTAANAWVYRGDGTIAAALADGSADVGGAKSADLAKATINLPNLKALASIPLLDRRSDIIYNCIEFDSGSGVGGHYVRWSATQAWTSAQIGLYWPDAALNGYDGSDKATLYDDYGSGVGAWIKVFPAGYTPHFDHYGAIGDADLASKTGTDDTIAIQRIVQLNDRYDFSGGRSYLISDEIAPVKPFTLWGKDSTIFQSNKTKPGFNMAGCSGSSIHYGDFTHRTVLADYDDTNNKPFFFNAAPTLPATSIVDDVEFCHVKLYETARQAIRNDGGGARWNVLWCHIEDTLRDGVFLLNTTDSRVSLSAFINTGDDSIAFAGNSSGAIASNNTIRGAGSFNLGGSGIRCNSSGVIIGNTVTNSDLFGIICAVNSADPTAKPDNLKLIGNTIKGIVKTGTVTAGIGFRGVTSVECAFNDIEMNDKEAHAVRVYEAVQSVDISIFGGKIKNCLSVVYVRNAAFKNISVSNVKSEDCTDFILMDATGTVDEIKIISNESKNTSSSGFYRASSASTASVARIITSGNKVVDPNAVPYVFNSKIVGLFESHDDEWVTGVFADYSGDSNVGSIVIDGRLVDKTSSNGSVTFNATNSGLISFGANPMARTPLKSDLIIVQETTLGAAKDWHVDFVDSNNFRIRLDVTPGADVTFSWAVSIYNNRKLK